INDAWHRGANADVLGLRLHQPSSGDGAAIGRTGWWNDGLELGWRLLHSQHMGDGKDQQPCRDQWYAVLAEHDLFLFSMLTNGTVESLEDVTGLCMYSCMTL